MPFKLLFELSPDALIVVTHDGQIELVNQQVEKLFGYGREELIGQPIECLAPDRLRERHQACRTSYIAAPCMRPMGTGLNIVGRRKDGSDIALDIQLSPLSSGEGTRVLAVVRDITERKLIEAALFEEKERTRATLGSIGDAVISTDITHHLTYLNKAAERMTGWSCEEAVGRPLVEVFHIINSVTGAPSTLHSLEQAIRAGTVGGLAEDSILVRRNESQIPIEDSIAPIHDANGQITGTVIIFRDVSKSKAMERQTRYLAHHDFLTGLPNRVLLNDRLIQAIALAGRRGSPMAVLFLDVDHFKHINDSLGHSVGDKLLQSMAERLKACVRSSDTISRTGGDEFVILLPEIAHADDVAISAQRMLFNLGVPHTIDNHDLQVTVSIGISVYPDDGMDAETLIKNADMAMYDAKSRGRNSYRFFTPEMNRRSVERQTIEAGLRQALQRDEFVLHYQPKINLETKAVIGAEALIRWRHAERGLLYPRQFIPVAEDCGLITPIDRWVLQEACRQVCTWETMNLHPVPVAVNISATELRDKTFLQHIRAMLNEMALEPSCLEVELTEGVLMQPAELPVAVLQELKSIGVRLVIDDFGTGYSSLSYLRHFPIDVLKIDQSFVHEIDIHPANATIISALIGMCEGLGCRAIAEGVETEEQVEFLRACRCREAQGYYFGRPMIAEEFSELLVSQRG